MADRKEAALVPASVLHSPFAVLRQLTTELDRAFDQPFGFTWPAFGRTVWPEAGAWAPKVDVIQKEGRLVTRIDLPGVKREDVTVEVTDGYLAISGERKREIEEKKDNVFRKEREHGTFYRAVALPEGVKPEEVKATFVDGVLEVAVPLPARPDVRPKKVEIEEPAKSAKTAA
jgi:HSP20 family protein